MLPDLQSEKIVEKPSPLAYILAPIFIPPVWATYQAFYYTTKLVESFRKNRDNLESKFNENGPYQNRTGACSV